MIPLSFKITRMIYTGLLQYTRNVDVVNDWVFFNKTDVLITKVNDSKVFEI